MTSIAQQSNGHTSIEEADSSHLSSLVKEEKFNGMVMHVEKDGEHFLGWGGQIISPTFKSKEELFEFEKENRYDVIGCFVFALLKKAREHDVINELTKEKVG